MENENYIVIRGKRFHHIWLRDHCLCPKCYHSDSSQKIYDTSQHTLPPKPISVDETDTEVRIVWQEDPVHESSYSIDWLLKHAYDPAPQAANPNIVKLWKQDTIQEHHPKQFDAASDTDRAWIKQLLTSGFAIINNLEAEQLHPWLSKNIGPLHISEYGLTSRIKPRKGAAAKDLGLSAAGHALSPHTDGSYRFGERLVQFLYVHENTTIGGETILVDGFCVAQDFMKNEPEAFKVLSNTPIGFQHVDHETGYLFRHTIPILLAGHSGDMQAIYYSAKNNNWRLPFDQVEEFYAAYRLFSGYINDDAYHHRFRLEPGNCLLIQNFRVLHARDEYDPSSGRRDLETGYLDWSFVAGRQAYEQLKGPLN